MSQSYYRYYAHDFERRWQKRLKTLPCAIDALRVKVTRRFLPPTPDTWELRPAAGLPVDELRVQFSSREEASKAGNLALKQLPAKET